MTAMQDAGFIIASYAVTFAAIAGLAWRFVVRGRRATADIDDADKYWT